MDTEQRMLELMGGINLKSINGGISIEEFKGILQHNQEQYAIMEAKGEQFEERLQDLICLVLAEKFHPMAVDRFGDTGESSLRQIITEIFQTPEAIAEWRKSRQLVLSTLSTDGFDESQMAALSEMYDSILKLMIDFLVQRAGRLRVIPIQEASVVTGILAQMMKEQSHADDTRNN